MPEVCLSSNVRICICRQYFGFWETSTEFDYFFTFHAEQIIEKIISRLIDNENRKVHLWSICGP